MNNLRFIDKYNAYTSSVEARVLNAITAKLISTEEVAKMIGKGLKTLHNMPAQDIAELSKKSFVQLLASDQIAEPEKKAILATKAAMQVVDFAISGFAAHPEDEKPLKKFLHSEGAQIDDDFNLVSSMTSLFNLQGIDMNWTGVFTNVSGAGKMKIQWQDRTMGVMFRQLPDYTSMPKYVSIGNKTGEEYGPYFFGAGVNYSSYDLDNLSVYDANEMLSAFRQAYAETLTKYAYRVIFEKTPAVQSYGPFDVTDWANESRPLDKLMALAYEGQEAISIAKREMRQHANQTKTTNLDGRSIEAPLNIDNSQQMVLFVNDAWERHADRMNNASRFDSQTQPQYMSSVAVIATTHAPRSGGYTLTHSSTSYDKNDPRFLGTSEEIAAPHTFSGMGVFAHPRNQFAQFRPLTFIQSTEVHQEVTKVTARAWLRMVMDERLKGRIVIADDVDNPSS